ncbi:MAG: sugar ABC transporter substrate-binding protein [Acidimicrobiia bacterium]
MHHLSIRIVALMAALLLVLAACGNSAVDEGTTASTEGTTASTEGADALGVASCEGIDFSGDSATIAYMPPATEFPYYVAIGKGIEDVAAELGYEVFTLAPLSDNVEIQVGMLQDVLQRDVDAVILSTHDEQAAAPLVRQIVESGIPVTIVNSDIANFPTPINAVVGYIQRSGTQKLGEYALERFDTNQTIGIIEGLPGYHSTERVGGFLDAIEGVDGMEVVVSIPGGWNVEGGNAAAMDILQAYPELTMIVAANDYMATGANIAAKNLGREDVIILGNDGDTQALEEINSGEWEATVMTTPFDMGQVAMRIANDCLNGKTIDFFTEIPTEIVDQSNAITYLQQPDRLYPLPSKEY